MKLHKYLSASGKDVIAEYIDSLTRDEQIDALSVLECMENGELDKIFYKRWEKKIYEVYFRKHNRIFYVTADADNIYFCCMLAESKRTGQKNWIERL